MPDDLFDKVSHSSGVLDSPTARAVTDGSVRLRAARAGAKRLRRRSSAGLRPVAANISVTVAAASNDGASGVNVSANNSSLPDPDASRRRSTSSDHLRTLRSRAASAMFWEAGTSDMPEGAGLDEDDMEELTRRRALSMDMLEVELQQKDAELKMAAEIGLKLFEKSESSAALCKDLELQVLNQKRALEELEMENEVMQRKYIAQRRRHEKISCENLKLTNEVAQVDVLRDQLEEAHRTVSRLELSVSRANSRRGSLRSHRSQASMMGDVDWFAPIGRRHSRRATGASSQADDSRDRVPSQDRIVSASPYIPSAVGRDVSVSGDGSGDDTRSSSSTGSSGGGGEKSAGSNGRDPARRNDENDGMTTLSKDNYSAAHSTDHGGPGDDGKILLNVDDVLQMEALCEQLQRDADGAKDREEEAKQAAKESVESVRQELEEAHHKYRQLQNDNEQLMIEIEMGRHTIAEVRKVNETLIAHAEEDKDMINVLRSRVASLSDEIEELERTSQISPRISSADVALRMLDMELRSPIISSSAGAVEAAHVEKLSPPHGDGAKQLEKPSKSQRLVDTDVDSDARAATTGSEAGEASAEREKELHDRLVAKLQSQTALLMNTQTDLNSAENQLQMYKRQLAEWLKNRRPEFSVKGNVNEEGGFVLYELSMMQEGTPCHTASMRYSAIAAFRSDLKRKLFVGDKEAQSVRLPALPPKVWGNARSRSATVVKQREDGLRTFLNVMLALAELSELVGSEFFKWLGWTPEVATEVGAEDESKNNVKGREL